MPNRVEADFSPDLSMRVNSVAAPVRRQVAKVLRGAITSGRFAPGQRLIEKDLCELLGVSRPSVREALRELESEGLIEIIPNRGPLVKRLTAADAASVYQVRAALEALAARLFVECASDDQVAELDAAVERLAGAYATLDVEQILSAKQIFYDVLIAGTGNNVLRSMLRSLNDRITMLRRVTLSSPARAQESIREIRDMMAAIRRRDADAAYAVSLHHIQQAARVALAGL
ncbi:GntR family transcriptional regulator [Stella humosa]|uniref:GntR family transcriptional regulator n=1 Tax=Stella humosa TaxID=94 RepID=A0A3N1MDL3_9PROT|nr:GntR family transcriptional regulator [Stella humosa]ROQ01205.1 GntR family transcriptional regulator [Stella humosa]BBK31579.1 GntR family transcriptional regulator [Stella humosa]